MDENNYAVSVIVPIYNTDINMLNECVQSIINQDFSDFEIILIDDGSADEYVKEIKKIAVSDTRIKFIRQNHNGVSAARNLAMSIAKGEYITFVDSDDVIMPYFLRESYTIAKKHDADFIVGASRRTADISKPVTREENPRIEEFFDAEVENVKPFFLGHSYDLGLKSGNINKGIASKLIKLDIVKQVQFPTDMKMGEDGLWLLKVLNESSKVCIVSQIWYNYRINPESATCRYNPKIISQIELFLSRVLEYIDLSNNLEYLGYVERVHEFLSSLVYRSFLGHKECDLSVQKRGEIFKYLYNSTPWKYIGEWRYIRQVNKKKRIRALLYKYKLLFFSWDLKNTVKKILRRS